MHVFAILAGLALAGAAAVPATQANTPGHLTYGDVQVELGTGCQAVPQNKDDRLPTPSALFTKLQVDSGYTCELYRQPQCVESFWTVDGPGQKAEYVDGSLFSAKCTAKQSLKGRDVPSCGTAHEGESQAGKSHWLRHTGNHIKRFNFETRGTKVEDSCQ